MAASTDWSGVPICFTEYCALQIEPLSSNEKPPTVHRTSSRIDDRARTDSLASRKNLKTHAHGRAGENETAPQRQVVVMHPAGVDIERGAGSASAEETHRATPYASERLMPPSVARCIRSRGGAEAAVEVRDLALGIHVRTSITRSGPSAAAHFRPIVAAAGDSRSHGLRARSSASRCSRPNGPAPTINGSRRAAAAYFLRWTTHESGSSSAASSDERSSGLRKAFCLTMCGGDEQEIGIGGRAAFLSIACAQRFSWPRWHRSRFRTAQSAPPSAHRPT